MQFNNTTAIGNLKKNLLHVNDGSKTINDTMYVLPIT